MNGRPPPLESRTPLRITTVSDWHVGLGRGVPGSLDAVVRRDRDDLPYVPGTTLTGVLRDACLTVARALDGGAERGVWQEWHRYAFGDAGDKDTGRATRWLAPAVVTIGAARLTTTVRRAIRDDPELTAVTTGVRVSVAIDQETGRAKHGALRFTEVAVGGLPLDAEVTVELSEQDDDARTAVTALLTLGCAWCTELGGDRRRGLGQVTLRLGSAAVAHSARRWAQWLAATNWTPPRPRRSVRTRSSYRPSPGPTADEWTVVDLTITTQAPVRVPRQTLGNVVRGHDHLPGSLLLPWLSQRWDADTVRAAIVDGGLVARNATPDVAGVRGLPVPLTLSRTRGADDGSLPPVAVGVPPPGFRQVRERWTQAAPRAGAVRLQQPALAQVSHNAVDRSRQRPTSSVGIYELEVIPAGRTLRSQLVLSASVVKRLEADHGARWWERLDGPARFGARRRGEYGAATVAAVLAPVEPPVVQSGHVTLWAVSDVLVRGPGLRYSADPDDLAKALTRLLDVRVAVEVGAARTSRRESWHGGWQLPRETMTGLAAGTVVRVTVADGHDVDPVRWHRLLLCGVGDRTAEGFGEIVLDPPLLAATAWQVEDVLPRRDDGPADDIGDGDAEDADAVRMLAARSTHRRITDAVVAIRSTTAYGALRADFARLSRSQRGTWLAITATSAVARSARAVRDHAQAWRDVRSARRAAQVTVATRVLALLSGGADGSLQSLLAAAGVDLVGEEASTHALAVLVADVVDGLRREPDEEGEQ